MLDLQNGHVIVQQGDAMKRSVLIVSVSSVAQSGQGPPSSKKEDLCSNPLGAGRDGLARSNNFGVMAGART